MSARIIGTRSGREEIGQQAEIGDKNAHHLIGGGAGKGALKHEPHHGDAEQDAEDAVARDGKIGLDGKVAEVDQVEREGKLHAGIGKPGARSSDPRGNKGDGGEEQRESADGIDVGENEDLGAEAEDDAAKNKCPRRGESVSGARSRWW